MGAAGSTACIKELIENGENAFPPSKMFSLPFVDDEFEKLTSLSVEDIVVDDRIIWLRPNQIGNGNLFYNHSDPKPNDVLLSDSIYDEKYNDTISEVASIMSVMTIRSDYLQSLFIMYNANAGVCAVKLYRNCKEEVIVIDDYIPCLENSNTPLFIYSNNGDCWVPLLLKALAKVHGSYLRVFQQCCARELLHDLTGEVVLCRTISSTIYNSEACMTLFNLLYPMSASGNNFTVLINNEPGGLTTEDATSVVSSSSISHAASIDTTISASHSLSLLGMKQPAKSGIGTSLKGRTQEELIVQVYSPYYHIKRSPAETESNASKLHSAINWLRLLRQYQKMYTCILRDQRNSNMWTMYQSKWISGVNNGGPTSSSRWRENPMCRLTLLSANIRKCKLSVCLSTPDKSTPDYQEHATYSKTNSIYPDIGIAVCRDHPVLHIIKYDTSNGSRDISYELDLLEGVSTYALVLSCGDRTVNSTFYITAAVFDLEGNQIKIKAEALTDFEGFYHSSTVEGKWTKGLNSFGPLGGINPSATAHNTSYRLRFSVDKSLITPVVAIKVCLILVYDKKIPEEEDTVLTPVRGAQKQKSPFLAAGTFLVTPNFLSRLKYYTGTVLATDTQFGTRDDGLIGNLGFSYGPMHARYNELNVKMDQMNYVGDTDRLGYYYVDYIAVPTTKYSDEEGSYILGVKSNIKCDVQRLSHDEIEAPTKLYKENLFSLIRTNEVMNNVRPEKMVLYDTIKNTAVKTLEEGFTTR